MSFLKRTTYVGIAAYAGFLLLLTSCETSMVYPAPARNSGNWNPALQGLESVTFPSQDGTHLVGWYLEHPKPRAQFLFFHGNGEHLGYLSAELDSLRQRYSVSIFAFDYRGYGRSQGKPNQKGVLADGLAAQSWLAQRASIPSDQIVLFGRSLGGAVAVHNAKTLGARGLILDRTFDSLVNVAAATVRFVPVRWIMRNRFPSSDYIADYTGPLLQLHGEADSIVPMKFGRRLFDAAPSAQKLWLQEPGLGHNDPRPEAFDAAIEDFLGALR